MLWQLLVSTTLAAGWMLSVDVLVRLGNGIGLNSTIYLPALALGSLLAALATWVTRASELRHEGKLSATVVLVQGAGSLLAMTVILAARSTAAIILPVGLLVSAGFAFNEIFLYWFPNFGFAFLVLGGITFLHLLGEKTASNSQPFFTFIAFAALFILCLAGLGGTGGAQPISVDTGFTVSPPALFGALLLFLGYDYITPPGYPESRTPSFLALFCCLLLFLLWSMISLQHVPADKLGSSTVPHLIAARAIFGQTGRVLMGTAIIAGTCGLVNMLFFSAIGSIAQLSERNLLPGHAPGGFKRRRYVLLFAAIISALLAGGLAGKEHLEAYVQATLLLWLLYNGVHCLAASRLLLPRARGKAATGITVGVLFIAIALLLMVLATDSSRVFGFIFIVLAATTIISLYWLHQGPAIEILGSQHQRREVQDE